MLTKNVYIFIWTFMKEGLFYVTQLLNIPNTFAPEEIFFNVSNVTKKVQYDIKKNCSWKTLKEGGFMCVCTSPNKCL